LPPPVARRRLTFCLADDGQLLTATGQAVHDLAIRGPT
jgi:hypothetical protein